MTLIFIRITLNDFHIKLMYNLKDYISENTSLNYNSCNMSKNKLENSRITTSKTKSWKTEPL